MCYKDLVVSPSYLNLLGWDTKSCANATESKNVLRFPWLNQLQFWFSFYLELLVIHQCYKLSVYKNMKRDRFIGSRITWISISLRLDTRHELGLRKTYVRRSVDILCVFWTSCVLSVCFLCLVVLGRCRFLTCHERGSH